MFFEYIHLHSTYYHQDLSFEQVFYKAPDVFLFVGVSNDAGQALFSISLVLLFPIILPHYVTAIVHNDSFSPDAILRVTTQNVSLGGVQRLTTLVNGSMPGPELRVPENETAWIRVYNDMKGQNLIMVSRIISLMVPFLMLFY